MAIVSATIPNLINGVSQQPFALRLASQAEEQINGFSSVAEGLLKRPGTKHVATISTSPLGGAYVHTINRDSSEKYTVIVTNGNLRVFGFDGIERTVNFPNGKTYLNTATPETSFGAVTVADYTFLVNKEVTTGIGTKTAPAAAKEALVWVRQGNYSTTYNVTLNGATYSHTTLDGSNAANADSVKTDNIAAGLATKIAEAGWVVNRYGSILRINLSNGADFTIGTSDSMGDTAIFAVKEAVQSFTELPKRAWAGFKVTLSGSPSNAFDTYYVEYADTGTVANDGVWKEVAKPGRTIALNGASMPHALIREANGTFTFKQIAWGEAACGDDDTNPHPSFIGRPITDIFFYRNRLGLISDENVVFSRSGSFFDFYRETVTSVLDTDPVDLAVSHVKVSNLRHAIPFNESLLLFSDQTQFTLTAAETLTPATATISQTTEFEASLDAKPVGAGRYVYFASNRGGFTGVREYYIDGDTQTKDANDVTSHVPRYIPAGAFKLAASTNEDTMLVLTRGKRNTAYVYKWFFSGQEKVQSCWSKWEFDPDAVILNADIIESTVWLVIQRPDGVFLERMDLELGRADAGSDYATLLDRLVVSSACVKTYDPATNKTTITLPFNEPGNLRIIADGSVPGLPSGYIINHAKTGPKTLEVVGDHTSGGWRIGRQYELRYRFSPILLRDQAPGGGMVATTEGRLQITFVTLNYAESGYFRVEVTPFRRDTYEYVMSGRRVGSARNPLGAGSIETGVFKFPVIANNFNVTLEIVNDSHLPSRFLNAEWEGKYTVRSIRRS